MIVEQLSQVGIHVTLNKLAYNEFNTRVIGERNTSMYLIGWGTISVDGGGSMICLSDLWGRTWGD